MRQGTSRGDVVQANVGGVQIYLVVTSNEENGPVRLVCKGGAQYQLRPAQLRPTTQKRTEEQVRALEGR